jgi:alpha-L-fucosidase
MQQRLLEMGDWLKVNGEAIYGTRYAGRSCQWSEGQKSSQDYGEFRVKYDLMNQIGEMPREGKASKQLFFTKKPGALYAITTGWLAPRIAIRNVRLPEGAEVTLLGRGDKLNVVTQANDIVIETPRLEPNQLPCRYCYAFKLPGAQFVPE